MDTKTAIVTGASSGIGLALAQAYPSRHRSAVTLIQRFGLAANLNIHLHLPGARRRLASGIADGRGLAAAFALGAEGVRIGTAFLPCAGSGSREFHLTNGKITDWTDYYDGLTARRSRLAAYFTDWGEL